MLKLDTAAQRFKALKVPYNGSFFGIAEAGKAIVAFGLRGNVYRSDDGGATWAKADAGLAATVVGATRTADGATAACRRGWAPGVDRRWRAHFRKVALKQPVPVTGLADIGNGRFALVGTARRHGRGDRGALSRRPHMKCRPWPPSPPLLDPMPIVRDVADFDRNSGNWLERLVFNNRLAMVIACAVVTVLLGYAAATRLVLNASFEKMIPQSQPYIKNYLDLPEGSARARQRVARRGRERRRRHLRSRLPRGAEAGQR